MEEKELRKHNARPMNKNGHHKVKHKRPVNGVKPEKNKKKFSKKKLFNALTFVFAGLAHIAFILIVVWSIKFSGISLSSFIYLYVVLGLLLAINDVILIVGNKYRDFFIKCVSCGISILLLVAGIFGTAVVGKINNTAGKVIQNDSKEQYETVNASLVVYDNTSIVSITDLANKKVGVTKSSTENEDSTSVGKKKLEEEGISVSYTEYDSIADTFMGLVAGEVDAAILPGSYNSLLGQNSSFEEPLKKTTEIATVEANVKTGESSGYNKNLVSEPFTVLLIGYAQESENYGLADSVILCSVNPLTYQVAMVSLARDSYVPICGGGNDKLTHARGQSRACLIQTVEDVMDEKVDFYMEINFQGVVDVVDALGGIVINNPVEFIGQSPSLERGNMTVWVPEGEFRANGEQALAFARERHIYLEGDFARQKHQQEVIKAIAEELFELKDVNKALAVMEAAGKNFSTNFSIEQLTSLFNYILKNGANTGVSVMNQMQIFSSRVTGYSSYHWNESAQLALWIYRLWNGSIKDNKWLLDKVTGLEDVKPQLGKLTFSYDAGFEETYSFPDTYNEEQIHEQLPTTVPNLIGMKSDEAQTWANGAGVSLGISYVETADTTLIGKVKSQSPSSGTSLDDCGHYVSIEVYSTKQENKGVTIPAFSSADEVKAWASTNGMAYATKTVSTTSKSLDTLYAGTSPEAGQTLAKGSTITALIYKYEESSTGVTVPSTFTTKEEVQTWATDNGMVYAEASSQETEDPSLVGTLYSTTPSAGSKMQAGETITAILYKLKESSHTHTWTWVTDTEATCDTTGTKHEQCTCGATQSEGTVIDVVPCESECDCVNGACVPKGTE